MKAEATISRVLIYASIVANMILGSVIFMRLETTPADVMTQFKISFELINDRIQESDERIANLAKVVDQRGEWMKSVDVLLTDRTRDRLYRAEFRQWCDEVKARNGDRIDLPDIAEESTQ
jgi:hypothetical protein